MAIIVELQKKYKIYLIIISLFVVFGLLGVFIYSDILSEPNEQTEERVDITEFSNILQIDKQGQLLSYPEITILSEYNGEVMTLNVSEGDIVDEWDILMQIGNEGDDFENFDIENQIGKKFVEYYDKLDQYNQFESEYGGKIAELENQLIDYNAAMNIAIDTNDKETENYMRKEIININERLTPLKKQREIFKSQVNNLENGILITNQESIEYYYELDKQMPRSPIQGIVGNIYVQEGDEVKNGDKLFTIIDNSLTPEISVSLDFNEYLLTKNINNVLVITENENRGNSYYYGEIYTRSPILNKEGGYTVTIRITEDDIPDLILSDENTKITVFFEIDSDSIWIPENCFTQLGEYDGILTLRSGEATTGIQIGIKNRWNEWNNVNRLLFPLEIEEEKDGIEACVEAWNTNPTLYEDESIFNQAMQFNNEREFCTEFVKDNPMFGNDKNKTILSNLLLNGDKIEVLCRLDDII